MALPWDSVIPPEERALYKAAGFGGKLGIGKRPALLIIDVQYRTVGHQSRPISEAIEEYATSCGEHGWRAVGQIQPLLKLFRSRGLPVIHPHVTPKTQANVGRFGDKVPSVMGVAAEGYEFVAEVMPTDNEILLPKNHPSAFSGTPLTSFLIDHGVDSIVFTGCTTSGCVRSSVVDAFSANFRSIVPIECVYDRSQVSHAVNLFDMASKYADVLPAAEVAELVSSLDLVSEGRGR
jgi:maleamate amidohydrolase